MAKKIISITMAAIMFIGAIVAVSFGSRAARIEQAWENVSYIPTTTNPPTNSTTSATTKPTILAPWLSTTTDGPFKTTSEGETTESTTETTTESTTTTHSSTLTTTTTTTTTSRPITTTTRPTTTTTTTTTTKPTTTTTKPTTTTTTRPATISVNIQYVKNAILYDATNSRILFEKNASVKCYPASTTKLLTASVALHYMSSDTVIIVGDEINMIGYDSSVCGIKQGYRMTLYQLIAGLMLNSGNDAAYTIAVNVAKHVSGNSTMTNKEAVSYFASLMNDYAKNLGAKSSNFVNPDGYHDPDHYTTAHDLLLITQKAISYPLIKSIASNYKLTISTLSGEQLIFTNTNSLLNSSSAYYYPGATGLKTGMTYGAGYCLVATATKNGRTLITIAMGASNDKGRCTDTINMLNAGFSI